MALSLATVGGKITAAFINLIIAQVNKNSPTAVIPTSVTGGTYNATTGVVNWTNGGTVLDINGIFTSQYYSYRIVINAMVKSVAGIDLQARYLTAGVVDTTAVYSTERTVLTTTTPAYYSALSTSLWTVDGGATTAFGDIIIELHRPAGGLPSGGTIQARSGTNVSLTGSIDYASFTAHDGLRLMFSGAGTVNSTVTNVRIFGYN